MFTCLKYKGVCEGVRRELLRETKSKRGEQSGRQDYSDPDDGAEQRLTVLNAEIQLFP